MNNFNVTYNIVTPESAEVGDYAESGFLLENCSLRDAFNEICNHGYITASCSPYHPGPHVWFSAQGEQDYRDGSEEERSLHCPKNITNASHRRIARLLGVKT